MVTPMQPVSTDGSTEKSGRTPSAYRHHTRHSPIISELLGGICVARSFSGSMPSARIGHPCFKLAVHSTSFRKCNHAVNRRHFKRSRLNMKWRQSALWSIQGDAYTPNLNKANSRVGCPRFAVRQGPVDLRPGSLGTVGTVIDRVLCDRAICRSPRGGVDSPGEPIGGGR